MEMKHVVLDTDHMTYEEVDALVQKLRKVRERKGEMRSRIQNFNAMIHNMKDDNLTFISKYTGEVLNPDDWTVYDEVTRSFYPEKEEE
jgi:hypothetical protein